MMAATQDSFIKDDVILHFSKHIHFYTFLCLHFDLLQNWYDELPSSKAGDKTLAGFKKALGNYIDLVTFQNTIFNSEEGTLKLNFAEGLSKILTEENALRIQELLKQEGRLSIAELWYATFDFSDQFKAALQSLLQDASFDSQIINCKYKLRLINQPPETRIRLTPQQSLFMQNYLLGQKFYQKMLDELILNTEVLEKTKNRVACDTLKKIKQTFEENMGLYYSSEKHPLDWHCYDGRESYKRKIARVSSCIQRHRNSLIIPSSYSIGRLFGMTNTTYTALVDNIIFSLHHRYKPDRLPKRAASVQTLNRRPGPPDLSLKKSTQTDAGDADARAQPVVVQKHGDPVNVELSDLSLRKK